ncbi:MAG: hypothetical protein AAB861_01565 [Patescibacteria group bacterium]
MDSVTNVVLLIVLTMITFGVSARLADAMVKKQKVCWLDRADEAHLASEFRGLLIDKIIEIKENSSLSLSSLADRELIDLLPVCQYADEWYAGTHPDCENPNRVEKFLVSLIGEG